MQILSKFYHNKHSNAFRAYDNSVLSRYFTHHNAQMRCYSTVLLLQKKQVVVHKKYYYKLKG